MPTISTTITGNWPLINGSQATGQVTITPVAEAVTPGSLIPVLGVVETLVNGAFSVALTTIDGMQLEIVEQINGAENPAPYTVTCHGGTLDLSTAPRSVPTAANLYLLASERGTPNGVAPLDGTGHVPQSFLPSTAAGVQSVTATNGTIVVDNTDPQNPKAAVGIVPESSVTGLVSDLATLAAGVASKATSGRVIATAGGLTGGGDLTADRTLAITYGTTAGTAAQGNDARIAGAVQTSLATAKGDLFVATGAGALVRLPVGADANVLTASSAQAAGVAWAPAAGGGGARMAITSGSITSGNVSAVNTGGLWMPIAGTAQAIAAALGDQVRAEYGFLTNAGASTYYDIGVVVAGAIVRLLNSPTFPPDPAYEGMPEANPDQPNQFFGPAINPWFNATSGDIAGGAVTFCIAWKSTGAGSLEMGPAIPVDFNLFNNHQ